MDAFIGEVRAFPYSFTPKDETEWTVCDGRELPVAQYQTLYAVIGNLYGGTPNKSFKVPDLRARVAVGTKGDLGLALGQDAGSNDQTLLLAQIPEHLHTINTAFTGSAADLSNEPGPTYAISRTYNQFDFSNSPLQNPGYLDHTTIEMKGGGQPHENRQPVMAITYFICHLGEFPVPPPA